MDASRVDEDLRQLGQLLWRYREQLEHLEHLLDVHYLLVTNGRDRWIGRVVDQLDEASRRLGQLDVERAELLGRLGRLLGLPGQPSLRDLVDRTSEPWDAMLADHVAWFAQEVARISDLVQQVRSSVGDGLAGVQQLLRGLKQAGGTGYDHGGRPVAHAAAGSLFFDDRA